MERFSLHAANLLSLVRIFATALAALELRNIRENGLASFLVFAAIVILTDVFDGPLARHSGLPNPVGRVLDPVADKLSFVIIIFAIYRETDFPHPLIVFLFVRDFAILACSLFIFRRHRDVVQSNFWGKLNTGLYAAVILVYVVALAPCFSGPRFVDIITWSKRVLVPVLLGTLIASSASYVRMGYRALRHPHIPPVAGKPTP